MPEKLETPHKLQKKKKGIQHLPFPQVLFLIPFLWIFTGCWAIWAFLYQLRESDVSSWQTKANILFFFFFASVLIEAMCTLPVIYKALLSSSTTGLVKAQLLKCWSYQTCLSEHEHCPRGARHKELGSLLRSLCCGRSISRKAKWIMLIIWCWQLGHVLQTPTRGPKGGFSN